MEIRFTLRAEKDLQSIYEYFAEVAPHKVSDVLNAIVDRTLLLLIHPEAGPFEPLLHSMGFNYRFLVEGNYKIIYSIDGETIFIIQVFDARQNPEKMVI